MILCFIHYFLLLQLNSIYEMMATSSRISCVGNYNILKNWHTWKKNTTNLIPMPNRFNGIFFSIISTPKHCMVNTIMIRTSHTRNFILFKTQSLMEWWLISLVTSIQLCVVKYLMLYRCHRSLRLQANENNF